MIIPYTVFPRNKSYPAKFLIFMEDIFLINTTVIIFHKKAYNPPSPHENAIMNPMRQLQLFSACCDIYKDCVR